MKRRRFNIITLDGGGITGCFSVGILDKIIKRTKDLINRTNLLAGTSTGSLIGLALAYNLDISQIKKLYSKEVMSQIFSDKHQDITRPKYNNNKLYEKLSEIFPKDLTLEDLDKYVIIPSIYLGDDKSSWKPIFYNNLPNSSTSQSKVIDVAMQSCATPVYFPSYNGHVDGSLIANDPSIAAITYVYDSNLGVNFSDINLLSIGTGVSVDRIKGNTEDWGALEWSVSIEESIVPIISLIFETTSMASQDYSQKILKDRFFRISTKYEKDIDIDDFDQVDYLYSVADNYNIEEAMNWINSKW
ncbi:MAG: patatin-like phospholipase family protein [Clostridioides sp.]|jgi:patatin-like phospholipase/acyl hydrolase|nr:patatin-like phospholipase family protein [Clostridioides sp.]